VANALPIKSTAYDKTTENKGKSKLKLKSQYPDPI